MRKNRKLCTLLLVALFAVAFSALVGCKPQSESSDNSNPNDSSSEVTAELFLEDKTISLIVGDEVRLKTSYNVVEGADPILYVSDNRQVVEIAEDGKLQAVGVGETNVTVSYAGETKICKVSVTLGDYVPTLEFKEKQEDVISTLLSESVNLTSQVFFNGKYYDDVQIKYSYSDESIGTVDENGIFIPKKFGTTTVTVSGVWRGQENPLMQKTVTINVSTSLLVSVNGGQQTFELYTMSSHNGQAYATSMPFVVTVEEESTGDFIDVDVSVVEGFDIIEFDGGVITANSNYKVGTAVIAAQGELEDYGQIYFEWEVSVSLPTPIDKTQTNYDLDLSKGIFSNEDLQELVNVTSPTELCALFIDGEQIELVDGKITNVKADITLKLKEVILATTTQVVKTKATLYTKIFYTADDLLYKGDNNGSTYWCSYFSVNMNKEAVERGEFVPVNVSGTTYYAIDGVYCLGADIDLTNDTRLMRHASVDQGVAYNTLASDSSIAVGFIGTFDGRGHSISGMTVDTGGLFGGIGGGAKICNLAVKDAKYNSTARNAGVFAKFIAGKTTDYAMFENIYVSIAPQDNFKWNVTESELGSVNGRTGSDAILAFMCAPATHWNNLVVDVSAVGEINVVGRGLFNTVRSDTGETSEINTKLANMKNTFVISSAPLLVGYYTDKETLVLVDAQNQPELSISATYSYAYLTTSSNVMFTKASYVGVATSSSLYRFDTKAAMATYISENSLNISNFTTDCWDISSGVPVWRN